MADTDQAPAAPDDNYGVQAPAYVSSNGDGTHMVAGPDGTVQTLATAQLPDSLLPDAISAVKLPGGASGSWTDAPPQTNIAQDLGWTAAAKGVGNALVNVATGNAGSGFGDGTAQPNTTPAPAPAPTPATNTQPPATDNQPQPAPAQPAPQQAPVQAASMGGGGGGGNVALANQGEKDAMKAAQIQQDLSKESAADQLAAKTPAYAGQQQRDDAFLARQQAMQDQQADLMQKRSANADKWANENLELPKHSLGQQLLSGLGIILGGIGGGIQGRGNPVLDQMQQKTQQFIDIQKYNMDHGLKVDDLWHNIYSDQRQLGADDEHAKALADNIYKTRLLNTLDLHALGHGDQAAAQQFYQTSGGLKSNLANQRGALQQQAATTNLTNQNAVSTGLQNVKSRIEIGDMANVRSADEKLRGGAGAKDLTPQELASKIRESQANKTWVPHVGFAQTPLSEADSKQLSDSGLLTSVVNQIDNLIKTHPIGSKGLDPAVSGNIKSLATQARGLFPGVLGVGGNGLSPKMAQAIDEAVAGNPGALFTEWKGRSQGFKDLVGNVHRNLVRQHGITEINPIQVQTG